METVTGFIFLGSNINADGDLSCEIKRRLLLGRTAMTNLDSVLKSRDHFADKGLYSQSYGFSSSHVHMWDLDHKAERQRLMLSKYGARETPETPLDSKEI